ncbi:MAG: hypothetical protein KH828_13390 [Clostridiales bacterium]|nr:hypothetical protein [Clostridiales bacterium]
MSEETTPPLTPLDSMISHDSLQVLKAAVPYMPAKTQQMISIYAKIMELSNTISFFSRPQPELSMMSSGAKALQPDDMLNDIRRFATGPAKDSIDQLIFALNTIQLLQMYQENPES